jgi:hypothetical protein
MKNVLFNIKSVITGGSKAVAGAGAEKNSFGSTTLKPVGFVSASGQKVANFSLKGYRT